VIDDFELLATLPLRDARAGMARSREGGADPRSVALRVARSRTPARCRAERRRSRRLIRRCAGLHLAHIASAGDPFEAAARARSTTALVGAQARDHERHELRHGEAVAIGMLLDARYAEQRGLLQRPSSSACALLERSGLPLVPPALLSATRRARGAAGLQDFREHLGGALRHAARAASVAAPR
jgi:3-dehydroquinate synthase